MKTESVSIIDSTLVARTSIYGEKVANIRLALIQDSFGEEGCFYPATSITVHGDGLIALRDLLNKLVPCT